MKVSFLIDGFNLYHSIEDVGSIKELKQSGWILKRYFILTWVP
jgi:hypothetical protein